VNSFVRCLASVGRVLALGCIVTAARADTLRLKDGTVCYGKKFATTPDKIVFKVNDKDMKTFLLSDVASCEANDQLVPPGAEPKAEKPDAQPWSQATRLTRDQILAARRRLEARLAEDTRRDPDTLVKLAAWCRERRLFLEAEDCLRAALAMAPDLNAAKTAYQKMADTGIARPRTVLAAHSPRRALGSSIRDHRVSIRPSKKVQYVPVQLTVDPSAGKVLLSEKTLRGKAGNGSALFLGFPRVPAGELKGTPRRGVTPRSKWSQIWEILVVEPRKQAVNARYRNTERMVPQRRGSRRARFARGSLRPPYPTVRDSSYFEVHDPGPYTALFVIPAGETLTEVHYSDEPPSYLYSSDPGRLSGARQPTDELAEMSPSRGSTRGYAGPDSTLVELACDEKARGTDRLAALRDLGAKGSFQVVSDLEALMGNESPQILLGARAAIREIRRRFAAVDGRLLPSKDPSDSQLVRLQVVTYNTSRSIRHGPGSRISETISVGHTLSQFCATLRLKEPGRYFCRAIMCRRNPETERFELAAMCEAFFEIEKPGTYWWTRRLKTPRGVDSLPKVFELWMGKRLLERRVLDAEAEDAAIVSHAVPVVPPPVLLPPEASERPVGIAIREPTPVCKEDVFGKRPFPPDVAVAEGEAGDAGELTPRLCPRCHGQGMLRVRTSPENPRGYIKCPTCGGRGVSRTGKKSAAE
jgi:hypothetical protein